MIISLAALLLLLAGVAALVPLGLRTGDQPGDVLLLNVEPRTAPRGASVTVANPGRTPVIVGMSLRRAGVRLRLAGPSYVSIRTGSTSPDLLAHKHAWVGVLDADETRTFVVPADPEVEKRADLVAVIGQRQRLRAIHRLVVLAPASRLGVCGGGGLDAPPSPV